MVATGFKPALLPGLLLLLWVAAVQPLPVGKDKGRSLPLVISQYSNVGIANRHSKKEPVTPAAVATTTTTTPAAPQVKEAEIAQSQVKEPVKEEEPVQDKVEPEAAVSTVQVSPDEPSVDHQGQSASDDKAPTVSSAVQPQESAKSGGEQDVPAALETAQKTDDVQTTDEARDEEKPSAVNPPADKEEDTTDAAVAASPSADETAPQGGIDADVMDEQTPTVPVQEPAIEEMKPETEMVDTDAKSDNAVVEDGQSGAVESTKSTESSDPIAEQSPAEGPAASAAEEDDPVMIHHLPHEIGPILHLEELFEEDRSFKNSPEEFNPDAVERIKAMKETGRHNIDDDDEEDLTANEESDENESIRLERDDRKNDDKKEKVKTKDKKKEKVEKVEKEKVEKEDKDVDKDKELLLLTSKPGKETKPHKKPIIDDPVKEYDDSSRKRRTPQDETQETAKVNISRP